MVTPAGREAGPAAGWSSTPFTTQTTQLVGRISEAHPPSGYEAMCDVEAYDTALAGPGEAAPHALIRSASTSTMTAAD